MANQTQAKVVKTEKTNFEMQRHDIFTLVKRDKEILVCFGNTQIVPSTFKTWADAKKYIDTKPYELIINVSCFCMEQSKNLKK